MKATSQNLKNRQLRSHFQLIKTVMSQLDKLKSNQLLFHKLLLFKLLHRSSKLRVEHLLSNLPLRSRVKLHLLLQPQPSLFNLQHKDKLFPFNPQRRPKHQLLLFKLLHRLFKPLHRPQPRLYKKRKKR